MTPRDQVALFLFGGLPLFALILLALDYVVERIDTERARARTWREIEVRCSRERHPSFRAPLFDQDKEVIATGTNSNEWRHYFN